MILSNKNKKRLIYSLAIILSVGLFVWVPAVLAGDPPQAAAGATDVVPPAAPAAETPAATTETPAVETPAETGGTPPPGLNEGDIKVSSTLEYIIKAITFVINIGTQLVGGALILFMEVIIWLSLYNRFIDNPYVSEGWVILRDLVNMFFVLGLLFIAFVTVLKIEKYQWNKLLARLLIMAILVNFSKTIAGLIIDFFQVLMITFVNAYKDITAGNIFKGLGSIDYFKTNPEPQGALETMGKATSVIAASIFGLIFAIISFIVIVIFAIILAFRIVALWALIVFSPLAFFAWVFQGQGGTVGSLANKWWTQFLNYCMIGPFLAFFLWLSVLSMAKLNTAQMVPSDQYSAEKRETQSALNLSKASSMDNVIGFVLGIVMLVSGLKFSQEFAVAGAGMAGRTADWMKNKAQNTLERGARGAAGLAVAGATLPFRPLAPVMSGLKEGASEAMQKNRLLKYGTKAGRERVGRAWKQWAKSPFVGEKEKREEHAKIAKELGALDGKKINYKSEGALRSAMAKDMFEIDEATGKIKTDSKGKAIMKKGILKKGDNPALLEARMTALADLGKLDYGDISDLEAAGFFEGKSPLEKQLFLQDMEDRVEKASGVKRSFSSLHENEETGEIEDSSFLEKEANEALKKKGTDFSKNKQGSKIDYSKIIYKDSNGIYSLKRDSEDWKNLTDDQRNDLSGMESEYNSKIDPKEKTKTGFYDVARASEIKNKRAKEVKTSFATASTEKARKFSTFATLADPTVNPDFAKAEMDGIVERGDLKNIGQAGRDNIKMKMDLQFLRGQERIKYMQLNKNKLSKGLQQKDGEDDNAYQKRVDVAFSSMDEAIDKMDEEQLQKYQKQYKIVSGRYDDFGRLEEGGEGRNNTSIEKRLRSTRSTKGITGSIGDKLKSYYSPGNPNYVSDFEAINKEVIDILSTTSDIEDDNVRTNIIQQQIESISSLRGNDSEDMAKHLIKNEAQVLLREKSTKDIKKKAADRIDNIIELAVNFREKGFVSQNSLEDRKINVMIDAVVNNINEEIISGGLSESSMAPAEIEQLLNDLRNELLTAPSVSAMENSIKDIRKKINRLGYKKSTKPISVR